MMTVIEFHSDENENLRECIRLLESLVDVIELISFGLAPNPNGFCYEILKDGLIKSERVKMKSLDRELDSLNEAQEEVIRELYL